MAITLKVQSGRKNRNRKEIYFSAEEIQLLKFAQLYYSVDLTSTIRILLRSMIIELIAKAKRDGVPKITAHMQQFIDRAGL
jgi:hypothetical protein